MNPNPSLLIKIPPSLENSQILTRDNSCLNKPNHGYNRMQMWPRQYECNPWEYEIITKDTMLINLSPQFKMYVPKGILKVWVSFQNFEGDHWLASSITTKTIWKILVQIFVQDFWRTYDLTFWRTHKSQITMFAYFQFNFTWTQQIWVFKNIIVWLIFVSNNNYQ